MANIKISGVEKRFGEVAVLHGIDLDIQEREFVALVGPSGCGKSTLLRIVAGLEEAGAGSIDIDGETVNDLSPRERDVAMVFQSYALYPHMNVYNNMAFTLRMRGETRGEIDRKVKEAAAALDLSSYLDRSPAQLSGGQRQRVAMGRALVRKPRLFLFDEPLSNLDAKLRVEMRTEIRRLHQHIGATSVYVTHDQIEAMTMADRIVVLNGGRIVQQGAPRELYERPASVFVATFIGSPEMNLFRGRLKTGEDKSLIRADEGIEIPVPRHEEGPERDVRWGIRPDNLELCSEAAGDITGTVGVVEYTGGETLVFVDTPLGSVCAKAPAVTDARTGDRVGLRVQAEALHMFDEASGLRIANCAHGTVV